MSVCAFFGHRDAPAEIESILTEAVTSLIESNTVDKFYIGNNGGFDRMGIRVLCKMKKKYPNIQCYIVVPYIPESNTKFPLDTIFPDGLEKVPKKIAIDRRNEYMVKQADIVICYVRYDFGGAAKFKRRAEKLGKRIIEL